MFRDHVCKEFGCLDAEIETFRVAFKVRTARRHPTARVFRCHIPMATTLSVEGSGRLLQFETETGKDVPAVVNSVMHARQLGIFNCRRWKHRKPKVELDPIPIGRGAVKIFVEGKGIGQPSFLPHHTSGPAKVSQVSLQRCSTRPCR